MHDRFRGSPVQLSRVRCASPRSRFVPPSAQLPSNVPSLAPMIERDLARRREHLGQRQRHGDNPLAQDEFFRRFFDFPQAPRRQQREVEAAGSGVIVDAKQGYILTNHHVVENADKITVTLSDNRSLSAQVVGSDQGSDLAVLKVTSEDLADMPLGDSSKLRVGDYVVAIGNPFGFSNTVTSGIVSALGRSGINRDAYEDFIQTDASINPGQLGWRARESRTASSSASIRRSSRAAAATSASASRSR